MDQRDSKDLTKAFVLIGVVAICSLLICVAGEQNRRDLNALSKYVNKVERDFLLWESGFAKAATDSVANAQTPDL